MGQGADSYIRGGPSENINFGSEDLVLIKNADVSGIHVARKAYLRFDISTFNSVVENAKLHLVYKQAGNDIVNNVLLVYGLNEGVGDNWDESNITWNNAPANITTSPGEISTNATLLGAFAVAQGTDSDTKISFSNDKLVEFINNTQGEVITLILSAEIASDDGAAFYSKENTLGLPAPALELVGASKPEPCEIGTVSTNLDIHMPSLNYETLLGTQNIWVDLIYSGTNSDGNHIWGLKDFGENQLIEQ